MSKCERHLDNKRMEVLLIALKAAALSETFIHYYQNIRTENCSIPQILRDPADKMGLLASV